MVQITIPSELDICLDADDPSDPGDIKVASGTQVTFDNCVSTDNWVQITSATSSGYMDMWGGYVRLMASSNDSFTAKVYNTTTSWDINSNKYIKARVQQTGGAGYLTFAFGESTYNENTSTQSAVLSPTGSDKVVSYIISSVSSSEKDAVAHAAITVSGSSYWATVLIKEFYSDPGPSQVKAYDGDRVITIYPKMLYGSYTGDGTTGHIIYLDATSDATAAGRSGTPVRVEITQSTNTNFRIWTKTMHTTGDDWSLLIADGGNSMSAHGIWEVGEGYFKIGSTGNVNTNNALYGFTAFYED